MKEEGIRLGIALPLTNDKEYRQFWDSFLYCQKPDSFVYIRPDFPGRMDHLRNSLVEGAIENNCTHILFMDTDQIYPPNTIPKLFSTLWNCDCKVAGTVVYRRYDPYDPLVFKVEKIEGERRLKKFSFSEIYSQEFLEVDAMGCGCVLYDIEIFKTIPKPWFEDKTDVKNEKTKRSGPGEDIGFCYKLKDYGFQIFVNTDIDIGHLSLVNINREFYRLILMMRKKIGEGERK
jgi:hypothetical protein